MQKQISRMSVFAAAAALVLAGGARGQGHTLHPLPFDESLSMYVAHTGSWYNYSTRTDEEAEIEDAVAAFAPAEEPTDDPVEWFAHAISAWSVPEGWGFYEPSEGEPMQIRIHVRDARNRLGRVEVTDWDTGAAVGALDAVPDGSEVAGLVDVDPGAEVLSLTVKSSGGQVLARAGARNPRVTDVIVVSLDGGWAPRRGDEHECPSAGPPYGDPFDISGTLAGGIAPAVVGCMSRTFTNDQPMPGSVVPPPFPLAKKRVVTEPVPVGPNLPPAAANQINTLISTIKADWTDMTQAFQPYAPPPFSQGRAHWMLYLNGVVKSVVYFPYVGRTEAKLNCQADLQFRLDQKVGDPAPGTNRAHEWCLAIKASLSQQDYAECNVLAPISVGDVRGLFANVHQPLPDPLENITQEVTCELFADKTWPDGEPGPLEGAGIASVGEKWTVVAPPTATPQEVALEFPPEGRVTVRLGKGWKWQANAGPGVTVPDAYDAARLPPFPVGDGSSTTRRLTCALNCLYALHVITNEPAFVELQMKVGEIWSPVAAGPTIEDNGKYTWATGLLKKDQHFRVRATGQGEPSDWYEFYSMVEMLRTVSITVPPGGE